MPFYEYVPVDLKESCAVCAEGFEVRQALSDPPLTECPRCKSPCRRAITSFAVSTRGDTLGRANLERHGFTQYRKVDQGVYEKTAGAGPQRIDGRE